MDSSSRPTATRRALLAGGVTGIAALSGCVRRLRNLSGRQETDPAALEIKTPLSDNDPFASRIASHLSESFAAAGIEARVVPSDWESLYQEVLFGNDFDIYVSQLPQSFDPDPDVLYPLLHSRFSAEAGWQNPFGFTDLDVDSLLDRQRKTSDSREQSVDELQTQIANNQPVVPVCLPELRRVARTNRFSGWDAAFAEFPYGLLRLTAEDATSLTVAVTDGRITANRNPLSAMHHRPQSLLKLLYEPLVVDTGHRRLPWLADEIEWDDDPLAVSITLRTDLSWHDGESLTADDVAFSYRLVADSSSGDAENPIPAPRFRGPSTLIEEITVESARRLTVEFIETHQSVAEQLLAVPILPEHIWEDYTSSVSIAGIEIDRESTEAIITDNTETVGSGPFEFSEADAGTELVVSRFDDHFLRSTDDDRLADFHGGPSFEELTVINLSHVAAVELVQAGEADATVSPIAPTSVDELADNPEVTTFSHRSNSLYHLGFNTRRSPLSNPNFRQLVARLVDKSYLAETVFDGFGEPVASPLAGTDWLADDLEWRGPHDPVVPFLGREGTVDDEAAREAFGEAGYRYNEDGELLLPDV